jgi:hypothetical protein
MCIHCDVKLLIGNCRYLDFIDAMYISLDLFTPITHNQDFSLSWNRG